MRDAFTETINLSGDVARVNMKRLLEDPEARLGPEQRKRLEELTGVDALLSRWMYRLNRFLVRAYFGLEVRGRENLPEPPCVISPNHVSYLDGPAIGAAMDDLRLENTQWGGFTGVLEANWFLRTISRLGRIMPVDAQRKAMSSLACGGAVLARGKYLIWFPEGGISPDGELQPFKAGVGLLLEHFQAPVVPVLIEGTREAYPEKFCWPRRRRFRVTFGPARRADELEAMGEGEQSYERIAHALHDVLREMQQGG